MAIHSSITLDRVMEAVETRMSTLEDPGFCLACGADASQCEPDMEDGECEVCDESAVHGAELILVILC